MEAGQYDATMEFVWMITVECGFTISIRLEISSIIMHCVHSGGGGQRPLEYKQILGLLVPFTLAHRNALLLGSDDGGKHHHRVITIDP